MEGSETPLSYQSEESSMLDIPCALRAEDFLLNPGTGRDDELFNSGVAFVSPASTVVDADPDHAIFAEHTTGADVNLWPRLCEKTNNCVNTEPFQPNEHPFAWTSEQKDEGETTIRQSLDTFYETCCQKKTFGGSPVYEAASQCLCVKLAELANKDGTKYALKSLQMAQMVLNRDEKKIFSQPSSNTCFSVPTKPGVKLEEGKQTPGLSDDILQLILKQNATK
ncbi:shieldin complex subunit 1 isoform X2 [Hemicordylus capensis]|nr:shieldin complex subunit 1 isoform X2 [Hemicordylus capensis]XP_053140802.1 shieldin complex subunit 1 isoform X2 [Hemicordylus capensis]XP_053140803.1 shieldin complex subunit 1 isoform X2 [Hemicordylus capensis]XP_053140804.1 shieldin complex subunit 1 isoform X2 [Hemicordylus capensis]XP_053140805.1 shieldin complex subunit 1 isoform X2 [Hemicordylus capensis]